MFVRIFVGYDNYSKPGSKVNGFTFDETVKPVYECLL